jgi:predicted peptidase
MRNTIRTLAAALLLVVAASARADYEGPTGVLFRKIKVAEREYNYALYVPRNYDPSRKWPTITFLHGAGECGTDGAKPIAQGIATAVLLQPDKWPFLIIIAQKPSVRDAWEQHDDAVMAMLKKTQADYSVDETRLYLTGLSQGGHGTWAIGAKHPDLWAAIVPICGYGDPKEFAAPLKSMPIWVFHGDKDTAVPLSQSEAIVAAIKEAGGMPKLTVYPGVGHNSWDQAYRTEKLYEWFLQFKRDNPRP